MSTQNTDTKKLRLDVVLFREGEYWVGHCIQFGIATSGTDINAVFEDACTICKAQVEYAIRHDEDCKNLFRPAQPELMKMMATASMESSVELEVHTAMVETTQVQVTKRFAAAA